jgi:hypothetical protein
MPGGAAGAPVQRAEEAAKAISIEWLAEADHQSLADNVDRLAADNDLIQSLAFGGFVGREWEYFSTELARYGIAVIGGWMRGGLIFAKCRDRGLGGLIGPGRPFDDDEIEELTGETVSNALVHFRRDVLIPHKWDYRKGATVRTYFVGQCLIRFANVYRRWHGNEIRNRYHLTGDNAALDVFSPRIPNPDQPAVDRTVALEVISGIKDPRVRKAMFLTADGWTQAEIADELGVTEKTVERMLANERARIKRRQVG